MKKLVFIFVLAFAVALVAPVFAAGNGNPCPSNKLYQLEIIGTKNKTAPLTGSNRKSIFIGLTKNDTASSRIYLTQGDFKVCDANPFDAATACDGTQVANLGSVFQLPCNLNVDADVVCDGQGTEACYSVFARPLGNPTGHATVQTCATLQGIEICSMDESGPILVTLGPRHGKSQFVDVTQKLTTLSADITNDNVVNFQKFALFSGPFQDWFWQFTNTGLRLAQLAFCDANCP